MNKKAIIGAVLGLGVLVASTAASAHVDVAIGVGVPTYVAPQPVYAAPMPVRYGYYNDDWRARRWHDERAWRHEQWRREEWRDHHRGW